MKITFKFKGSVFKQENDINLEIPNNTTIISALRILVEKIPHLASLLFKGNTVRSDIIVIVDKTDIISMNLLEMILHDQQEITVLPLAHGGTINY
ncbi:MAG: MoaD/ThiS family protein [Candidatus Thorarchaeota archaeon]